MLPNPEYRWKLEVQKMCLIEASRFVQTTTALFTSVLCPPIATVQFPCPEH